MNEFDYDVWQKKIIARGAYHIKRGSRSKKCSLPYERLSPAQRKKLNGEVVSYNMDKVLSWETFKKLQPDTQKEYLEGLRTKFGVSASRIARDMFKISPASLTKYVKDNGVDFQFVGHGPMSNKALEKWEEFVFGNTPEEECLDNEVDVSRGLEYRDDELVSKATSNAESCNLYAETTNDLLSEFSLTFSGDISAETVYNSLRSIMGNKSFGILTVSFKR